MSFLSGLGRMLGNIGQNAPMAQAALNGDYQAMAAMRQAQQRQAAAQAEAERERLLEARRMEALGNLGLTKDQISAFTATDASGVARDRSAPTPSEFDRLLSRGGIERGSPQDREMNLNRANSLGGSALQLVPITDGGRVGAFNRYTAEEIGAGPQPVRVTSEAEVARLPSGTVFIGPDGRPRRKP